MARKKTQQKLHTSMAANISHTRTSHADTEEQWSRFVGTRREGRVKRWLTEGVGALKPFCMHTLTMPFPKPRGYETPGMNAGKGMGSQ